MARLRTNSCFAWSIRGAGACALVALATPWTAIALDLATPRPAGLDGASVLATTTRPASLLTAAEPAQFFATSANANETSASAIDFADGQAIPTPDVPDPVPADALAGLVVRRVEPAPNPLLPAMPENLYMGKRGLGLKVGF